MTALFSSSSSLSYYPDRALHLISTSIHSLIENRVNAAFIRLMFVLLIPGFFDVALRDLGLLLAALALGRLSQQFAH